MEAVTRALNVDAFIVCSACRIKQVSSALAIMGLGTVSVNMYRKLLAWSKSSRGWICSSPRLSR
ncbi:MAG: hypothetical protein KatS3mg082_0975 [Nitrospiraceae bacterium]|nr:MAG: hypothetical protein KatS3mg082_0975 [Nitrospiraceae bacterium]